MNSQLLADIWNILSDRIETEEKPVVAREYVSMLLDYDVSELTLKEMMGMDTYLDAALEYALDDEPSDDGKEWN